MTRRCKLQQNETNLRKDTAVAFYIPKKNFGEDTSNLRLKGVDV